MAKRWKTVHGKTHSWNAMEAEQRGELPLTRAIEAVYKQLDCKKLRISRRRVRDFLKSHCCEGYHHVAGYNAVRVIDYYRTELSEKDVMLLKASVKKTEAVNPEGPALKARSSLASNEPGC